MIPVFLRQLFYIAETQSFAAIARGIGIPYRKVLALRAGKIVLSSAFKSSLRNMYQRTAYSRLRKTGFSPSEARRWSWYRPEEVVIKEKALTYKIGELTTGAVAAKLRAEGIPTTPGGVDKLYDDLFEQIKAGISESIEPTQIIMDY